MLRTAEETWELEVKHSKENKGIFDNLEDFPKELPFIMASGKTK
ncbi:MAG: hypothetical protein Q4D73_01365 [Actinomycetaceae bacterium]|nr:hypothetical protein [Actinomycetaceae bacterium]